METIEIKLRKANVDTVTRLGLKYIQVVPSPTSQKEAQAYLDRLGDHLAGRLAALNCLRAEADLLGVELPELVGRAHSDASNDFLTLISGR